MRFKVEDSCGARYFEDQWVTCLAVCHPRAWRVDDHALGMKLVMGMVEGQQRAYQEKAMDIVASYITGISKRW